MKPTAPIDPAGKSTVIRNVFSAASVDRMKEIAALRRLLSLAHLNAGDLRMHELAEAIADAIQALDLSEPSAARPQPLSSWQADQDTAPLLEPSKAGR